MSKKEKTRPEVITKEAAARKIVDVARGVHDEQAVAHRVAAPLFSREVARYSTVTSRDGSASFTSVLTLRLSGGMARNEPPPFTVT